MKTRTLSLFRLDEEWFARHRSEQKRAKPGERFPVRVIDAENVLAGSVAAEALLSSGGRLLIVTVPTPDGPCSFTATYDL